MDLESLNQYEREYLKRKLNTDNLLLSIVRRLLTAHIDLSQQALLALSTELAPEEFKINHVAIKYDIRRMQYIQRFIDDTVDDKNKEETG